MCIYIYICVCNIIYICIHTYTYACMRVYAGMYNIPYVWMITCMHLFATNNGWACLEHVARKSTHKVWHMYAYVCFWDVSLTQSHSTHIINWWLHQTPSIPQSFWHVLAWKHHSMAQMNTQHPTPTALLDWNPPAGRRKSTKKAVPDQGSTCNRVVHGITIG